MADTDPWQPLVLVYGGSFDPVHRGHIAAVDYCLEHLPVDAVIILPCAHSPYKAHPPAQAHHRLHMLQLAFADDKRVAICDWELRRPSPSYTIDSVCHFSECYPKAMLAYLVGEDALMHLDQWQQWQQLVEQVHWLVLQRHSKALKMSPQLSAWLQQAKVDSITALQQHPRGRLLYLHNPLHGASSSAVRQGAHQHLPVSVQQYIAEQHLYWESIEYDNPPDS